MKKIISLLLLCVFACGISTYAQDPYTKKELGKFAKEAESEAKKAVKKLDKEKWVYNGVGTLQKCYERFLLASEDFGGQGTLQTYEINNAPSLKNGEKSLLNMAQAAYAQENMSYLTAELAAHSGPEADVTIDDNIQKSMGQFSGDVKRSFTLYKKNRDGSYNMRGFFIIDGAESRGKLRRMAQNIADEAEMKEKIRQSVQ